MAGLTPPHPLDGSHHRDGFDCGRDSLNQWFHRHALRNQKSDTSRTSIIRDVTTGDIAGYVSLSATQIERAWLAKSAQRNRPDPLPALLLGQLAVDVRYQGRGCATSLLFYALKTAVRLSNDMGCFCVLTHPLDDGVRGFYRSFDFEDLPFDPGRSMAVKMITLKQNGF